MKTFISFLLLAFVIAPAAKAQPSTNLHPVQPASWRLIGTAHARFTADHDGIVVQGAFNNFRELRFKATDAPIRMVKVVVTYQEGAPDNIETFYDIPKGSESPVIDLRGVGERKIRRIDFWYDMHGAAGGHADIAVYAMK
jgi:hypothetical protein